MKTTGRLTLMCSFAAVGAGLAICVGTSAHSSPNARNDKTPELVAMAGAAAEEKDTKTDEKALPGTRIQRSLRQPSDSSSLAPPSAVESPRILSPPPPLALVAPSSRYGQEAASPPSGGNLPDVLGFLQKKLTSSQKPAPPSTPPVDTPTKSKTTVDGEGDGKLNIHIYDEDIRKVLDLLGEQGKLNILASKNVKGKVSATLNGVGIDSALRAILKSTGYVCRHEGDFIFVGTPSDFNDLEQAMDQIRTRTYRPNYVTAAELKALITPLLTENVGVVSVSTPAESGIGLDDSTAGGDQFSGGDVLVVRDYEAVLSQIDQMVTEIDTRPMQVSIEAMILSVKLKDTDKFGVNFQFLRDNPNVSFGLGSPVSDLSDFKLNGGLKFGFIDTNLGAFLDALEQVGDTNVVANPRLMVLNKQRAEIQIGEKKGYISQTITETTSTQSVEFLELGAQLRLRPFISSDGLIRMEVHPELSDGDVKVDPTGITLPNKELTQVTTNIMVRDGCTVVIGGLIREQLANTTTQVPVLGNLPFVGFAFRQTEENTERHEVLVLITPRIIYEPDSCQEGARSACEFLRRQSTYADKMSPFGKRSIARRYYRLAENAYAANDRKKALRFVEMAVHFDPLNRASLDLRSDIWLGKPYAEHEIVVSDEALPANPLDGEAIPGWLIDDLENAPSGPPRPMHPLDPGVPGSHRDLVRPKAFQ